MSSHSRSLKRWTAILGAALCLLVFTMAYLIWRDGQARNEALLTEVDVLNIRIQREGFDDIQLTKINDQWQLEAPCNLAANEQRLTPLLGALAPGAHQYAATEVDLDAAGLINPDAIVYINDIEHRIGSTDLNGERRYVQRNNTVVFAPEWILSLVNGGVTALAQLEVFAKPLSGLTIISGNGESRNLTLPDDLMIWQNLTAQQIATWPLPDVELTSEIKLQTVDGNGLERMYSVYTDDSLTAIRLDGAACAYILPADALPQ